MSGFSDVFEGSCFAGPVVWAVEKEITGGTGNGRFSPGNTCTQAQILTSSGGTRGFRSRQGPPPFPAREPASTTTRQRCEQRSRG